MSGSKERGLSSPPNAIGGQECPRSNQFLDPFSPIDQHQHRLPHWQQGSVFYFVTWRLADSLPRDKLERWNEERALWSRLHPQPWDVETESEYHRKFSTAVDNWLDANDGSCVLRDQDLARIVFDALQHFDGKRYSMDAFVVMPNHVHALFRLLAPHHLESVVQSWKGFSAREINRRLGKHGRLWQPDYWVRLIRNESHWLKCREYIQENPIKARLSQNEYVLFIREKERGLSSPQD
jgi:REP element-mobilizing transposase RayT